MNRLTPLDEDGLSDEQQAYLEQLNSGPRSAKQGRIGLIGPYGIWAHAPGAGTAAQELGAALRFNISLPENIKEAAICTVGAFHHAKFEFAAHRRLGLAAGLSEACLDRLQAGEAPGFEGDEDVAHRVADNLLRQHRLEQATYDDAVSAFGETGTVELVNLIGYYVLVSYNLNAFQAALVPGMTDPFPEYD